MDIYVTDLPPQGEPVTSQLVREFLTHGIVLPFIDFGDGVDGWHTSLTCGYSEMERVCASLYKQFAEEVRTDRVRVLTKFQGWRVKP